MELEKRLVKLDCKEALAENLERIMNEKGLTQTDLAKLSGLKQAAISHILTKRRWAAYETIVSLSKALKIEHTDLTSHPSLLEGFKKFREFTK
jgi:transcriptional regulator with XRE-family HTH domain